MRTCEVTRNRVTVKYSYTCSRGRMHYARMHESQVTGESRSETGFWLVFAVKLLQELNFFVCLILFSRFILLFFSPLISLSVLPCLFFFLYFLILIPMILYILFITPFLLQLSPLSFSVIPFFLASAAFPYFLVSCAELPIEVAHSVCPSVRTVERFFKKVSCFLKKKQIGEPLQFWLKT